MSNRSLGKRGEDIATQFLQTKGHQIVERNFKCKLGEIDLIAKDGNMLCFIEVKTRISLKHGMPFEAVGCHKQRKMAQLAQCYLKYKFRTVDVLCRFDVVSIHWDENGKEYIEHIPNAFGCG